MTFGFVFIQRVSRLVRGRPKCILNNKCFVQSWVLMYFSNLKWGEAESIGPNRCESDVPLVVPRLVVPRSANRHDVLDFHALTTVRIFGVFGNSEVSGII